MTCAELQRWLDDGRPEQPGTLQHIAGCAQCAHEHRAALDLDRLLSIAVTAEADFHDVVMHDLRPRAVSPWLQIAAEPAVPVSIAVAAVVAVEYRALANALAALPLTAGIAAALAPLTFWASWQLFRLYRRMTEA